MPSPRGNVHSRAEEDFPGIYEFDFRFPMFTFLSRGKGTVCVCDRFCNFDEDKDRNNVAFLTNLFTGTSSFYIFISNTSRVSCAEPFPHS